MRGGSPSKFDRLSLSQLEATLRVVKEQQLNIEQQMLNLEQQLLVVKHMDLGSSRTVSSAGEGGSEKPVSRASA